jgi:hypothetical protein
MKSIQADDYPKREGRYPIDAYGFIVRCKEELNDDQAEILTEEIEEAVSDAFYNFKRSVEHIGKQHNLDLKVTIDAGDNIEMELF